jgi:quinoprotein glucose dehydrogenase
LLVLLAAVACGGRISAQSGATLGEWRAWAGDLGATRYAPLDQINAANFSSLEVAWRFKTDNLGPRPDFNLQASPLMVGGVLYFTAGARRAAVAVNAATGELLWMHRLEEGKRADNSSRRLSGRGVGYWTDGRGDDRIFYVTIGYQLVGLNAKTGDPLSDFGVNGVVDLKQEIDQQLDPVDSDIGWNGAPVVARNVVIVGAAHRAGEREGLHSRLRRAHRQTLVDLPHDSAPRRVRQRDVARRLMVVYRPHGRLDPADGRRRAGHRVPAG